MSSTQEAGDLFAAHDASGPAHTMLRSPTVLIASVGLWGMCVYSFRLFGIDYIKVLKYDLLKIEGHLDEATLAKKDTDHETAISTPGGHHAGNGNGGAVVEFIPVEGEEDYGDEDFVMEGSHDHSSAITWLRLVTLSVSLLFMLHSTYFVWIDVLGGGPVGAVFSFYSVVCAVIVCPAPSLHWLRRATAIVFQRSYELFNPRCFCLITTDHSPPPRPVPFVDVFFADVLCSLSKVFFDWGILLHMAANPGNLAPSTQTILIPSFLAAVPYFIRARQCLLMYTVCRIKLDPKRNAHLWNALKYSTSIFPLLLSAYSKTVGGAKREGELEFFLIILLAINAFYALFWDIVMDWGMMQNPTAAVSCTKKESPQSCWHAFLRNRLRFGVAMSALILMADAVLRFSWMLRFYKILFPNEDSFVLCTQFLEVFRRAIWILLRVEWENLKQLKMRPNNYPPPTAEMASFLNKMQQPSVAKVSIA